jgi:hypothetical protein
MGASSGSADVVMMGARSYVFAPLSMMIRWIVVQCGTAAIVEHCTTTTKTALRSLQTQSQLHSRDSVEQPVNAISVPGISIKQLLQVAGPGTNSVNFCDHKFRRRYVLAALICGVMRTADSESVSRLIITVVFICVLIGYHVSIGLLWRAMGDVDGSLEPLPDAVPVADAPHATPSPPAPGTPPLAGLSSPGATPAPPTVDTRPYPTNGTTTNNPRSPALSDASHSSTVSTGTGRPADRLHRVAQRVTNVAMLAIVLCEYCTEISWSPALAPYFAAGVALLELPVYTLAPLLTVFRRFMAVDVRTACFGCNWHQ